MAVPAEVFDFLIADVLVLAGAYHARPTLLAAAHARCMASTQTAHHAQEHPGSVRPRHQWPYAGLVPERSVPRVPEPPDPALRPTKLLCAATPDEPLPLPTPLLGRRAAGRA